MKTLALVLLMAVALTPCFASDPFRLLEKISLRRDSGLLTPECQQGILLLLASADLDYEEKRESCSNPTPNSKGEFVVTCSLPGSWKSACKSAGGEVCDLTAKASTSANGMMIKARMERPFCVPTSCKKGRNLPEIEGAIENMICRAGSSYFNCDIDFKCSSSKAAIIVVAVLLGLTVAGAAAVGGFFIWKRYYAANTPPPTATTGDFNEYTELAQYEEEEADIIADTSINGEGEEDHPIN